jgi:long-chain acyl-CoA synthetase
MRNNTLQYIHDKKEEFNRHVEDYINELKAHVNNRVNRFSQIHAVIVVPLPFEKTPTMKIKRYLYC